MQVGTALTRDGWLAFGAYLLAAWFSLKAGPHAAIHFGLPACAAIGLIGWRLNYLRYRLLADTPRSRLASAALGRVELYGIARCHPGNANYSPASGRRCAWYRYWQVEEKGRLSLDLTTRHAPLFGIPDSCEDSFLLDDGGHQAIVLPQGAEVSLPHSRSWSEDGVRTTEEWIEEGDPLYISGELSVLAGNCSAADYQLDVGAKLAEWKQDQPRLLQRFDLDHDGHLSEQEWALARKAAAREVAQDYQQQASAPATLLISKASDGHPFLITSTAPLHSASRFRLRAWLHCGIGALTSLAWLYLSQGRA